MDDTKSANPPIAPNDAAAPDRLVSVDALRGFDMFWIIGAGALVKSLQAIGDNSVLRFVAGQLKHKEWEGFAFEDLIFPLFVFIVGMSVVFSVGRMVEREGKWAAHVRIVRRFLLLYLLGIFYYGGFEHHWPEIRLVGVLQRLALCYLFTALLFCHLRLRGLVAVCVALLAGYWAWLTFVPVPDVVPPGAGATTTFEMGKNWACYVDKLYLPGRRIYGDGTWDPEGLLSTLPAIASCLLGVFAARLITEKSIPGSRKLLYLVVAGVVGVAVGFLWGLQFPVIKKIWTSSYVLVAGGYSCLLLAAFYLVVDMWKFRLWARPFLWIGSNALTIYLAANVFEFEDIAKRFVGGDVFTALGRYGELAVTTVSLGLVLLLARFLYKKKIFIRV